VECAGFHFRYSAADIPAMLSDVGMSALVPMYEFLASEPDLAQFAPPMVDTYITYGVGYVLKSAHMLRSFSFCEAILVFLWPQHGVFFALLVRE
jgi:hypothetical protein